MRKGNSKTIKRSLALIAVVVMLLSMAYAAVGDDGVEPGMEQMKGKPQEGETEGETLNVITTPDDEGGQMIEIGPEGSNDPADYNFYYVDDDDNMYRCSGHGCDEDGREPMTTDDIEDAGLYNDEVEYALNQNRGFLQRFTQPVDMSFRDAMIIAGGFVQLGIENEWWSDDSVMGDFLGVSDFISTEFGQVVSGNWEQSICRYSTDYDSMAAEEGVVVLPGQMAPSAWITGEVQRIVHPSEDNPSQMVEEYWHRIEVFVSSSGLTEHSGESDCNDHIKFYIVGILRHSGAKKRADINLDGEPDLVDIACDTAPYTLTGSSALVIPMNEPLSRVCLEFHGTNFNNEAELVLGGDRSCRSVKVAGAPPDMGSCSYCPGSGGFGGLDLGFDLNLGLGGGDDDSEPEPENRPQPPAGDDMPEGGNAGMA